MIEIKNVSKIFKKWNEKKNAVCFYADQDLTFTAKEGEIVGILGPNGAGKTTLLRIIAGILEPTTGQVLFDGKSYQKDEIAIKNNLAFLMTMNL